MRIYLGADHRGFELKEEIKNWLSENEYEVEDVGAFMLDPDDDYMAKSLLLDNEPNEVAYLKRWPVMNIYDLKNLRPKVA